MYPPSISIIVPVYNVAPYVYKCLQSVGNQTYNGVIECLIIDDCGKDDSIGIAEHFINEYNGNVDFKIIRRAKNGGLSAARNTGIKSAKGDYLFFLDSDDYIIPECIELLTNCLKYHPHSECVFAGAKATKGYEWMSYKNKKLPEYSNNPKWIVAAIACRYLLNMTSWNKLVKRDFILDNNILFEEGLNHEDEIWAQNLSLKLHSISICDKETYIYQVRDSGIIAKEKDNKEFEYRINIWNRMVDYLPSNAPVAILGCLFFTQNHWELSPKQKEIHNRYLWRIANHSRSIECFIMKAYLLLPEFLQKTNIVSKVLFRFFDPWTILRKLSPVI